jgi:signal transduction histidine kinase
VAAALLAVQAHDAQGRSLSDLLASSDSAARDRWPRALSEGVAADLGEYRAADGRRFVGRCIPFGLGMLLHLSAALGRERAVAPCALEIGKVEALLAELAHELRDPLSAVLGGAVLLRRSLSQSERESILDRVERQALDCLRLIEDLLDIAHVMSDRLRIRAAPTDLLRLVQDSVAIECERAERKGHWIEIAVPADVLIDVDRSRLQQVLVNLLANAISYTEPGGTITLAAHTSAEDVEICVRDSGRGIAREHLPHVFEQSTPTAGREAGLHLGIGLRLVRRIVELHGGTVSAASAGIGFGAEFRVSLPGRVAQRGAPVARSSDSPSPVAPPSVLP